MVEHGMKWILSSDLRTWSVHRGHDRMVVGFSTSCAISAVVSPNPTHCEVYQIYDKGMWFYVGTPHFSINRTDRHHRIEMWLKVALNEITIS